MAQNTARLEELQQHWFEVFSLGADEQAEARRLCLPIYEKRYICWLHWVERLSWEAVGRKIGRSETQTRRLAKEGIAELYALMPERWRREPIPNAAPR